MKKGLTFALLMVAMVALVVPAGAMAPIIKDLPAVIIGDAGDVSEDGTSAVLLRYVNVFNLGSPSVIEQRTNPGDPSQLRVFYQSGSATLKASNATSIVQPLTAGELTALENDGTIPASKVINTSTDLWLSLIQDAPGAGSTSAPSAVAANFEDHGATTAELTAAGVFNPTVMTLFATDGDEVAGLVADNQFVVYSIQGVGDSYSPPATLVKEWDFEGTNDGWTYLVQTGAGLGSVPQATSSTGVGFNVTPRTDGLTGFASWYSPLDTDLIPAEGMDGKIYRARLSLSGNAASSALAPGYRFLYVSSGFMHMGGFQVLPASLTQSSTASNSPFNGNDVETRAYWAVPTDLVEYSDAGSANGGIVSGLDFRDYFFYFDVVSLDPAANGTLILENLAIESLTRPGDATPAASWGTGGTIAFNVSAEDGGWSSDPKVIADFAAGTATVSANSMTIGMGTGTAQQAFKQINPTSQGTVFPEITTGDLYRLSYRMSCGNPNNFPTMRFFVLGFLPNNFLQTAVFWADIIDGGMRGRIVAGSGSLPGGPKAAGSLVEWYYYAQNASTGAETSIAVPLIDIAQNNSWNVNGWARPAANVTITAAKLEVLSD